MSEVTLHMGDCLEYMRGMEPGSVDAVVTDPPYPNKAGHFDDAVSLAREFLKSYPCNRFLVFWDEMELPPVNLPLVARHVWHRTNTNRPDNYEAIYEFCSDGIKRPSRVFTSPVVFPGLTGCIEATGHPTQKPESLIRKIIKTCNIGSTIFDPFMGSGTTGVAAVQLGRNFIGCEIDPGYFAIAEKRIAQAQLQMRLEI